MKSLIAFLTIIASVGSIAEADSASGSCTGNISNLGYFYAYTYQYAYLFNGKIGSETHTFSFSGALADMRDAEAVGNDEAHIFYESKGLTLAVPFHDGARLLLYDHRQAHLPGNGWQTLCNY